MKKQRTMLALLLAVMMTVSLLSVCGSSAAAEAPETRTITDVFGREVEIPAEVKTCAALGTDVPVGHEERGTVQQRLVLIAVLLARCFSSRRQDADDRCKQD